MTMNKKLLLLALPFCMFGLVSYAKAATLVLSPASGSIAAGSTLNVDIMLDTTGDQVDGVDIYSLHYNASLLEVVGGQLTAGTLMAQTLTNTATGGLIKFSQVTATGQTYNGSGKLATITFKGLANGTSAVTFDFTVGSTSDTNVAGSGVDKLTSVTNGSYTVTGGSPPPPPPPTTSTVTAATFPSGTIFKYADNPTVYILEGTTARPITDWSVYLNQVPTTRPIVIMPSTITFTTGSVLGLRSGTLIKASDNPTVYLITSDGKKLPFTSEKMFTDHNYGFSNVYSIADVNLVNAIPTSTADFSRPRGTLFKYASSATVYYLTGGMQKLGYTSLNMFNIWNSSLKDVVTLPSTETYPDGGVALLPNGILVKGSSSTIYLTANGTLRPLSTSTLITDLGFTSSEIKTFSDSDIALQTIGDPL